MILYNGSNICLFYGSNSWSYTLLGHIDGLLQEELRTFLKAGESNIRVTLSLSDEATSRAGDVNGDGNVNITDVTILISMVLTDATPTHGADVNGDGAVNISDVTGLINMLLSEDV